MHTTRCFSFWNALETWKQIISCWHIVYSKIIIIFDGKITDRTPTETSVTDCGNITWSPQICFLKRLTLSPSKTSVSFFLDFLGRAIGHFLYLDFLYMSAYVFGKYDFWNFQAYHHLKFKFSFSFYIFWI